MSSLYRSHAHMIKNIERECKGPGIAIQTDARTQIEFTRRGEEPVTFILSKFSYAAHHAGGTQ